MPSLDPDRSYKSYITCMDKLYSCQGNDGKGDIRRKDCMYTRLVAFIPSLQKTIRSSPEWMFNVWAECHAIRS